MKGISHPLLLLVGLLSATTTTTGYTHADSLRGGNGRGRDWWNLLHYDLKVDFDIPGKIIHGSNTITLQVCAPTHDSLQLDLQEPLMLDSVMIDGHATAFANQGKVWWVVLPFTQWHVGETRSLTAYYHGQPRPAVKPPWDGGFTWTTDDNGKPWVAVSCQNLGASVWFPCKDQQWDEPDSGVDLTYTLDASTGLTAIGNGRPGDVTNITTDHIGTPSTQKSSWHWAVRNPINNYDITFYIGDYVHWHQKYRGEDGPLDLDFWVLRQDEQKARKQFAIVPKMMSAFEHWLGPYPFYEDGYKLVEAPYLGMEHQSAVAYGNKFKMGYLGDDRTGTGIGLKFDYIIVHESGHEWFGNSVTACDEADNWIQEGITTYSESLFAEYLFGTALGKEYCRGEWRNIFNMQPIIGVYGVNNEGSPDMYDKGAAIFYMIREMTGNDNRFRKMLRGLSSTYYHKTTTTQEVETYISTATGLDLHAFFNQYLRTTKIPEAEYYVKNGELHYKFNDVVAGFELPVTVTSGKETAVLKIAGEWHHQPWKGGFNLHFSDDFLIRVKP